MKTKFKIAILALSSILGLSACSEFIGYDYGSWSDDSQSQTSSSDTESQTSSDTSSSSDTPEPEPELDPILRPYEPGVIDAISPETGAQIFADEVGSKDFADYVRFYMGDTWDFLIEHNHMSEKDFAGVVSVFFNIVFAGESTYQNITLYKNIINFFAHLDTDRFLGTLEEIANDETVITEIKYLFTDGEQDDFGSARGALRYLESKGETNAYLEQLINEMFDNIDIFAIYDEFYSFLETLRVVINEDFTYMGLRVFSRVFLALQKNFPEDIQLETLLAYLFGIPFEDEVYEQIEEYLGNGENILDLIHCLGGFFKDIALPDQCWLPFFKTLGEVFKLTNIPDTFEDDELVNVNDWNSLLEFITSVSAGVDGEGMNLLFRLLSDITTDFTAKEMEIIGLPVSEESFFPDDATQQELFEELMGYYEAHFNVYTQEERDAITRAFATFGISYDTTYDSIKDAIDDGEVENLGEFIYGSIMDQVMERMAWSPRYDDVYFDHDYTINRHFFFRQNDVINPKDLGIHFSYWDTETGNYYSVYSDDINFKVSYLDTSKVGVNYFELEYNGETFRKIYYVIPKTVNLLLQSDDFEPNYAKLDDDGHISNSWWNFYNDENFYADNNVLFINKGTVIPNDLAIKFYGSEEPYIYNPVKKSYDEVYDAYHEYKRNNDPSYSYDSVEESLYFRLKNYNIDTSDYGSGYIFQDITINIYGETVVVPGFLRYVIVDNVNEYRYHDSIWGYSPYDIDYIFHN